MYLDVKNCLCSFCHIFSFGRYAFLSLFRSSQVSIYSAFFLSFHLSLYFVFLALNSLYLALFLLTFFLPIYLCFDSPYIYTQLSIYLVFNELIYSFRLKIVLNVIPSGRKGRLAFCFHSPRHWIFNQHCQITDLIFI